MARYRKIDPRIWNDAKFRGLSDNGKLAFLFLLTHPHMTSLGAMRATLGGLAEELGWSDAAFKQAFQEASDKGMAEVDCEARMIALPKFIRYNRPESPNVIKAWEASLDLLPECSLKTRVIFRAKDFAEGLGEAFGKALPEIFVKGMPYQEPEQKQECKPSSAISSQVSNEKRKDQDPVGFAECWSAYPKRSGGNSRTEASKAYVARLKAGAPPAGLLAGVQRYAAFVRAKGSEGTEFVKQASTFFGTGQHWKEAWEPPKLANGRGNAAPSSHHFTGAL